MEVADMHDGRRSQLYREFLLGCALCLGVAFLAPLSLWQGLGDMGSALAILVSAAALVGAVVWRNQGTDSKAPLSQTSLVEASE
jgi:hypothetical protein